MSKKGSGGSGSGKSRMDKEAAARIQSASDKNPRSSSKQSGFSQRAQSSTDKQST